MKKSNSQIATIKNIDLANKHGKSKGFITMLLNPEKYNKFTEDLNLAYDLGKITGKKPVSFMPKKWRKVVVKHHGEMNRKAR